MRAFRNWFLTKTNTSARTPPQTFVDCLNIVHAWNVSTKCQLDTDTSNADLEAAANTLVTCPYCSQHYYFADALEFADGYMKVECPVCCTNPAENEDEYEHTY